MYIVIAFMVFKTFFKFCLDMLNLIFKLNSVANATHSLGWKFFSGDHVNKTVYPSDFIPQILLSHPILLTTTGK